MAGTTKGAPASKAVPGDAVTITIGPGGLVAMILLAAIVIGGGIGWNVWRTRGGGPATAGGPAAATAAGGASEPVLLAEVNGTPITSRDVDLEFAVQKDLQQRLAGKVLDASPGAVAGFRRELLDRLVDRAIVVDAAAKAGITVDDAAAKAGATAADKQFGLPEGTLRGIILGSPFGLIEDDVVDWSRQQMMSDAYVKRPDSQAIISRWVAEHGQPQDLVDPLAQELIADANVKLHFDGKVYAPVREGKPAPDIELPTPDGGRRKLSDFRGQPLMVNFWATWCGPCRAEIPLFVNAHQVNKDKLVILGVDSQETPAEVTPFMQAFKIEYPMVIDADGVASSIYRVKALPTTFFIDAQGIVVKAVRGTIHSRPELNGYLEAIMADAGGALRPLSDRLALLR
ncbi:MAG: redoxin domain-containing protein [Anaerolineae bacterium]